MNYKKTTINDLVADAKLDATRKQFLKDQLSVEKPNFLKVKKAYFTAFYPADVPVAKKKPKTMKDYLADLD